MGPPLSVDYSHHHLYVEREFPHHAVYDFAVFCRHVLLRATIFDHRLTGCVVDAEVAGDVYYKHADTGHRVRAKVHSAHVGMENNGCSGETTHTMLADVNPENC